MDVYIYCLKDHLGKVGYVGQTTDLKARYASLLRTEGGALGEWLRGLVAWGHKPVMALLETCDEHRCDAAERGYIEAYKAIGEARGNLGTGGYHLRGERALARRVAPPSKQPVLEDRRGLTEEEWEDGALWVPVAEAAYRAGVSQVWIHHVASIENGPLIRKVVTRGRVQRAVRIYEPSLQAFIQERKEFKDP